MPEVHKTEETPVRPVKIGFYESKDGGYNAYMIVTGLPDKEKAQEAAEYLADLMRSLNKGDNLEH